MNILTKLTRLLFKVIIYLLIIIVAILFIPGIPPTHVKFETFIIKSALKLVGKLTPNDILNNAQVLKLDKEIDGPESISIRGDEIYFGDKSGKILKVKNGKVTTIMKQLEFPCAHVDRKKCSYPLATRFDPMTGKLGFTDIYGGLFWVDVDTGKVEKLIARGEFIDGAPVGFPEDLDFGKDGVIYWSDGSTTSTLETLWNELLGNPSGRLLKYEPFKNKSTVLLTGLHFANGVQLSPNEDYILVSESPRCQIRRYYLKGKKKGQNEMFIEGLPGYPDNIRSNGKGGYYISLFSPRMNISLEESPNLRKILARTLFLLDFTTTKLYNTFPSEFTKSMNKLVTSLTELKVDEPRNGFIVELNEDGEIIGSAQSTNGAVYGISQITVGEKYSYLASPAETKIWVVNTVDLKN